jgi:hypothetical protein
METEDRFMNGGRVEGSLVTLPMEYWEVEGVRYGAIVHVMNAVSMVTFSVREIPVGSVLQIQVFCVIHYELDTIKLVAKIVRKELHVSDDGKGYLYGLEVLHVSEKDQRKLRNLLRGHMSGDDRAESYDTGKIEADLPAPSFGLISESTPNCGFYERGRCRRTHSFCDGCPTESGVHAESPLESRGRAPSDASKWVLP